MHPRGIELGLDRVGEVAARLLGSASPRPAPVVFVVAESGRTLGFEMRDDPRRYL